MAIHHLTPPIRGGERPRLPSSQIGPVTQAIRAMRASETEMVSVLSARSASPKVATKNDTVSYSVDRDRQRIRELRRAIADRIEADIALLDALAGDPDFEFDDELEDENEHGGDVQDEPHDAQFDDEHAAQPIFMGGGAFYAGSFGRDA